MARMDASFEPVTARILRLIKSNKMSRAAFFENSLPHAISAMCASLEDSQLVKQLQAELERTPNPAKAAAVGATLRNDRAK